MLGYVSPSGLPFSIMKIYFYEKNWEQLEVEAGRS